MNFIFLINKEELISNLKGLGSFFLEIKIGNQIIFDSFDINKKTLRLNITQKPIDNKANKQIIDIFKKLGLKIVIKSGLTSKFKKIEIINKK